VTLPDITHRITLPYACFGISVSGRKVVRAAPIARWMLGASIARVEVWVQGKGGTMEKL
jgi:hypothetical protein